MFQTDATIRHKIDVDTHWIYFISKIWKQLIFVTQSACIFKLVCYVKRAKILGTELGGHFYTSSRGNQFPGLPTQIEFLIVITLTTVLMKS
jgi:hypothetical protein